MKKPEVRSPLMEQKLVINKITREELAKKIENMRAKDAELVTGIFKNLENPATAGGRGSVMFGYHAYPNDDFVMYELWDGEKYTLPRGVARHLNNNCYFKEYQQLPGELGQSGVREAIPDGKLNRNSMQMAKKIHRFAFHSLEYMDDDPEMIPVDITEVTVSP